VAANQLPPATTQAGLRYRRANKFYDSDPQYVARSRGAPMLFDEITRVMGSSLPRRQALRQIIGILTGAILTRAGIAAADDLCEHPEACDPCPMCCDLDGTFRGCCCLPGGVCCYNADGTVSGCCSTGCCGPLCCSDAGACCSTPDGDPMCCPPGQICWGPQESPFCCPTDRACSGNICCPPGQVCVMDACQPAPQAHTHATGSGSRGGAHL
jgi:hypothetical protein